MLRIFILSCVIFYLREVELNRTNAARGKRLVNIIRNIIKGSSNIVTHSV